MTKPPIVRRRGLVRGLASQAGFTLMEVLVALAIFAISVVGLVALESRSIESQRASREIRQAERIAQEVMADLHGRGFVQLIQQDFEGVPNPIFPYDDSGIAPTDRLRDMSRPPADIPPGEDVSGSVRGSFIVFRTIDWVVSPSAPPSNPPNVDLADPDNDIGFVNGLELHVTVLWIDATNPGYPPPSGLAVTDLVPGMADPDDPEFRSYVGSVQLRTVRVNDALLETAGGTGP